MNTINNPLILSKASNNDFDERYLINKEGSQSGEYVDKALAEEMLEGLERVIKSFEYSGDTEGPFYKELKLLISKAKG